MNLSPIIRKHNLSFAFFLASVFFLCFSRKLYIISLWPWFFFWIIEGNYKNKVNKIAYLKGRWAIILLPSIFAVFIFSLLWSSNMGHAKASLGEKLSLVLIPFFLAFAQQNNKQEKLFKLVRKTFIVALLCSSLFLIIVAFCKAISFDKGVINFNPVVNKWENVFLYYNFSYLIHPSYYAMMHLLGVSFCLQDLKHKTLFNKAYINLILALYFSIIIILTSSRVGSIALSLVIIYSIFSIDMKKILKISSIVILIALSLFYINHATRFRNIADRYETNADESGIIALFKTNIRYDLWISTLKILKDKPMLGSGIGDIQDDLNKEYYKNDIDLASSRSLNAHNQFLESWLSSGLAGLVILLLSLFLPLTDSNLFHKDLYYYFLIIVTTNFLFESIFNRVWGVAFFSIFYTLLTRRKIEEEEIDAMS